MIRTLGRLKIMLKYLKHNFILPCEFTWYELGSLVRRGCPSSSIERFAMGNWINICVIA